MPRLKLKRVVYVALVLSVVFYVYNFLASLWLKSAEEEDIAKILEYHRNDPIHFLPRVVSCTANTLMNDTYFFK